MKLRYYISLILIQEGTYTNNAPLQERSISMNATVEKATNLLEILPESDQNFALEFIKKLVAAWDPDYTKLTPAEQKAMQEAERDFSNGDTVDHDEINWD